jgi:hypothetical protein
VLTEPCFVASVLYTGVFENIACYQFHFRYDASGPLVQQDSPAKLDLDKVQSFDVLFSSDRSVCEFPGDRDSSDVVGSCTIGYSWNDRFTGKHCQGSLRWYSDRDQSLSGVVHLVGLLDCNDGLQW